VLNINPLCGCRLDIFLATCPDLSGQEFLDLSPIGGVVDFIFPPS